MKSIRTALACALVLGVGSAWSQSWPSRPVTLVVGTTAGSGLDTIARFLAQGLRERTGQPFIIDNRAGAAGNIGALAVAHAAPDGYTAIVATHSTHCINPHVLKGSIDPIRDFQPVTTFAAIGFVLLTSPQLPVKSVAELTAYAKEHPGKLSYASGNQFGRVVAEWYRQIYALDAVHVPYKGVPQAVSDLMAGRIDFLFADSSLGIATARSGKARALAMTTPKRLSSAPDLPTMMESGVEGFVADGWLALFFPAHTPIDITRRFAELTNQVMTTEAAREFLRKAYSEPMPGSPETLAKSVVAENAKWGAIVRKAGIEPE